MVTGAGEVADAWACVPGASAPSGSHEGRDICGVCDSTGAGVPDKGMGRHAWPSTGDVVDVASREIVATLTDETGAAVQSEKMVEIHFRGTEPVRTGDQFGLGRVMTK